MDVRDFDPHWLRQQVGMVMQEPFLFSGSIAENIAVGREDADVERMMEVAKLACVQDFVADMPLGYETKVGEQGVGPVRRTATADCDRAGAVPRSENFDF